MATTFSPSSPVYQGRAGGVPGGATFTDPTKLYILSPLTVHWSDGNQTYTFGSGFPIPFQGAGGGSFWVTLSDVGRTGTATISIDSNPTKWQQDGDVYACLAVIQVYVTPTGFNVIFGASGPNHAPGLVPDPGATAGTAKFLREDSSWALPPSASGTGTVTSVGLVMPGEFTVSNSPVTAAGNLTVARTAQSANTFLAGPENGAADVPTFRVIDGGDLPAPSPSSLGGVNSAAAIAHQFLTQIGTDGSILQAQPAFTDLSGTVADTQLPLPTPTTVGAIKSLAAVTHRFLTSIGTDGLPVAAQPAFTDISGSVAAAQLPNPGPAALGGVKSLASVSHLFLTSIGTDGLPVAAQPAFSDLTGSATSTQLPTPSATTIGAVKSFAAVSHQFLTQIGPDGSITAAQPAFTDISGSVAAGQLPNPGPSALGGVKSLAAVSHNFLTSIGTDGTPTQAQPSFSDISGVLLAAQNNLTRNAQTGTSYAITDGDRGKLVTLSNGSAVAVSIAQAGNGGNFTDGWFCRVENIGAGVVTITPATSTVDGAATITLAQYQGCWLFSDGTNYLTLRTKPNVVATGSVANQFLTAINSDGTASQAQPAFTDISGTASTGQIPNLAASKITSGQLALARGGTNADLSATGGTSQVLKQTSSGGAVTVAQLAFSDLSGSATSGQLPTGTTTRAITVNIDGDTATPSTGVRAHISIPFACTVTGWVLTADASGSAVIDVLRATYSNFPTTTSIAGTDKPTLSSVQKNENLGPLSSWASTAISAGDVLEFNLNSVTTCKILSLTLNVTVP